MKVEVVCTTDDPLDSLDSHRQIAESGWNVKVLPTWRSDKAMSIEDPKSWNLYLDKLSSVAEIEIEGFRYLIEALGNRHDFFHSMGCRLSDHGLNTFYSGTYTDQEISRIFDQARSGKPVSEEAIRKFKSAML
jgi:glucuronate isomerase